MWKMSTQPKKISYSAAAMPSMVESCVNLEESIEQRAPFKNIHARAAVNLLFTANWLEERLKSALDTYELTPQQYNALRILRGGKGPLSTSVIRERMIDKSSDVSRLVDRLLQKELVTRCTCASDKRLVDICITSKGLELLTEMDHMEHPIEEHLQNLSDAEALFLSQILDKIRG